LQFSSEEKEMLAGKQGRAMRKAMEILVALGEIYGAERMIPVSSVQIAGVSYDNLGEAGLKFLQEMADGGGKCRVLTTLNPAGMDVENWQTLGISVDFANQQLAVLEAFAGMGVVVTCTCTPYLSGNLPHFGEHIAWAESSAVCYANSMIGARSNREGGPSALAAALTGRTPDYGLHLAEKRKPDLLVEVCADLEGSHQYGALGMVLGARMQAAGKSCVPYLTGIENISLEEAKSLCASLATYGGAALFHIPGATPEADSFRPPADKVRITQAELDAAAASITNVHLEDLDFVNLGCPHLSIHEIARIANLLDGKKVGCEFWITTSRMTKSLADRMGYTRIIEASGAKFAADTCCVVAPIRGRFKSMASDSAKACYYASAKHGFKTLLLPFDEAVEAALKI
jgi:predicted aconitase